MKINFNSKNLAINGGKPIRKSAWKDNFTFDFSKQLVSLREVELTYNDLNFLLDNLDVSNVDKDLLIKGVIKNKDFEITKKNINDIYGSNTLGIKKISLNSLSSFSFKVDKRLKFKNFFLNTEAKLNELILTNNYNLDRIFPDIKNEILLNDHKIKFNYNKNGYEIIGGGKILIQNNFDEINYLIKEKNDKINAINVAIGRAIIKPASFGYLPESQLAPAITIADNRTLKIKNIFFFTI